MMDKVGHAYLELKCQLLHHFPFACSLYQIYQLLHVVWKGSQDLDWTFTRSLDNQSTGVKVHVIEKVVTQLFPE